MEGVVKSAGRVLEIFEFFAQRHGPATVSEVSVALGFPLSSTSVLLKSLLALGYLEYAPRSREYQPTIRFAVLGTWIFERLFADEEEIPRLMDELQADTGETIVLAMQNGAHVDYIRVLQSTRPVRFYIKPGSRRPIWLPAAGKALLAQQSDREVSALVRRINAGRAAEEGRVALGPLLAELARVRADGYARSEASVIPDTTMLAMALPVPPGHRPLALGVGGPLERMRRGSRQVLALMRRKLEALSPAAAGGAAGTAPAAGQGTAKRRRLAPHL
jgi:DNA-binding IclR family transcriptional regulator